MSNYFVPFHLQEEPEEETPESETPEEEEKPDIDESGGDDEEVGI